MGGSRRVRRGITGVRNTESAEFGTFSESDISTSRNRTLAHSARNARPEGLSETIHSDRLIADKVHHKLYNTLQPSYVRQVLRAADPQRSGKLSREQLTQSLDRLHIGLNDAEKELVVRRVPADESGRVDMEDFMRSFDEGLKPLGAVASGQQCYSHGTRRPFEPNTGRFKAWDWRRPQSVQEQRTQPVLEEQQQQRRPLSERAGRDSTGRDGGERDRWRPMSQQQAQRDQAAGHRASGTGEPLGGETSWGSMQAGAPAAATTSYGAEEAAGNGRSSSHTQQAEDLMLMKQLTPKLAHHREKLRLAFRRMDQQAGGSGRIARDQFLRGVTALHLAASPSQLQRLTSVIDAANGGGVDYEKFCNLLEVETVIKPIPPAAVPTGGTLTGSLDIQPHEARQVAASNRAAELRSRLRARSARAAKLFKQCDINEDGRLSLDQLTHCCEELIPGISKREVACLMVKKGTNVADGGDGYQDYREFIRNVLEDEDITRQRDPHARPISPRNANGNSLVWTRPTTPPSGAAPGLVGHPGATTAFSSPQRAAAAATEKFDAGYVVSEAAHDAGIASVLRSLNAAGAVPDSAVPADSSSNFHDTSSSSSHHEGGGWHGGGGTTAFGAMSTGAAAASTSEPAPRRGRGVGRFYNLLQHDTSVAFKGAAGSPSAPNQADVYMRKTDPAFMTFQQDDLNRKQRHRQEHIQRSEWKADVVNNRVERDTNAADRVEAARLLNKGKAEERAQERAELYDISRRTNAIDEHALALFGRQPHFVSNLRANLDT